MTHVKTLLGALAVCAALLTWVGCALGPGLPPERTDGLTAAAVLATDGMAPDGRPGEPALDREVLRRLAGAASMEAQDARAADKPAG